MDPGRGGGEVGAKGPAAVVGAGSDDARLGAESGRERGAGGAEGTRSGRERGSGGAEREEREGHRLSPAPGVVVTEACHCSPAEGARRHHHGWGVPSTRSRKEKTEKGEGGGEGGCGRENYNELKFRALKVTGPLLMIFVTDVVNIRYLLLVTGIIVGQVRFGPEGVIGNGLYQRSLPLSFLVTGPLPMSGYLKAFFT